MAAFKPKKPISTIPSIPSTPPSTTILGKGREEETPFDDLDEEGEEENGEEEEQEEEDKIEKVEKREKLPSISFKPIKKRDIDAKADEIRLAKQLPKLPGSNVSFDAFTAWLGLLTPPMWQRIMIYVYRHFPIIDTRRTDPKAVKYINVITQPIPDLYDYILSTHGGGKYGFTVTDTEKDRSKTAESPGMFKATLEIPWTQYEPILNYREVVVEERSNLPYVNSLKAKGKIDDMGNVISTNPPPSPNQGGSGTDVVALVKELSTVFRNLNSDQQNRIREQIDPEKKSISDALGQVLLEKMKQEDPTKTLTTVMTVLQGMQPKQESSSSNLEFMKQLMDAQKENNKLMIELIKSQTKEREENKGGEEKGDSFDQFSKFLDFMDRIKGIRGGGGGGGPKSGWDYGVEIAKELGQPLLMTINNLLSMSRFKGQAPMGTVGPQGPVMPPPPPGGYPPGSPMPQPVYPSAGAILEPGKVVEMPINQGTPSNMPIGNNQVLQFLQAHGGLIIAKIQGGVPGWAFGQDVANMLGPMLPAMVKKIGSNSMVENAKQFPEFWMQVEPILGEEGVKQWVEEFIDYDKYDEEGNRIEEGDEGEENGGEKK